MTELKYKTEMEARQAFVLECLKWCGVKEGSADHKALMEWYNRITPLPRDVAMTATMAWCAAFLSAVAWKQGYRRIPVECSCPLLKSLAKAQGILIEDRNHVPKLGEWLLYDLNKNKAVDHIGIVTGVEGKRIFVCEGNFSDSVKNRFELEVGDERIDSYISPDYMELVDNSNWVGSDRPNIPVEMPETKEETMEKYKNVDEMPEWAQEGVADLVEIGVIEGVGDGDLGMNLTETRLAVWIWRLAKRICKKLGIDLK